MGVWHDLIGTTGSFLRLGKTGPRLKDSSGVLAIRNAGDSADANITVADEAYGTGWNGSLQAPTKNAVYDKIESIIPTCGTAQATTSGTYKEFPSLPSGLKIVIISLYGVSTDGTSKPQIQIGDGTGGLKTSGYTATGLFTGPATGNATYSSGFAFEEANASGVVSGTFILTLSDPATYTWSCLFLGGRTDGYSFLTTGYVSLSAALDRVRLTMINGTDNFDAGSWNIMYW